MKISVTQDRNLLLEQIYNPIILKSDAGEKLSIYNRDGGFEFTYAKNVYVVKQGKVQLRSEVIENEEDKEDTTIDEVNVKVE